MRPVLWSLGVTVLGGLSHVATAMIILSIAFSLALFYVLWREVDVTLDLPSDPAKPRRLSLRVRRSGGD